MVRAIKPARSPSGGPPPMGLADVMETILDKGMVIDSYVTASLIGVDGLTVAARMVVASPKEGWSQHETHSASSPQVPPQQLDGLMRGMPSQRMAPASTTPVTVSFRAPASGRRRAVPFSVAVVNPAAAGIGRGPEFSRQCVFEPVRVEVRRGEVTAGCGTSQVRNPPIARRQGASRRQALTAV